MLVCVEVVVLPVKRGKLVDIGEHTVGSGRRGTLGLLIFKRTSEALYTSLSGLNANAGASATAVLLQVDNTCLIPTFYLTRPLRAFVFNGSHVVGQAFPYEVLTSPDWAVLSAEPTRCSISRSRKEEPKADERGTDLDRYRTCDCSSQDCLNLAGPRMM